MSMSGENKTGTTITTTPRCASCGVTEGDGIKLKNCAACHLVQYCGAKCQREHRSKHKLECKERAAKLRDELLFTQPQSSCFGDCPICFLPLSLDIKKSVIMQCCGKVICYGCRHACRAIEEKMARKEKCPFCREQTAESQEEVDKQLKERAAKNDPVALHEAGIMFVQRRDYQNALKNWLKAIELGDVASQHELGHMYINGYGVKRDEAKAKYLYEQAAIGGHPYARHRLGIIEGEYGEYGRAIKHFMIASKLGLDDSLAMLKRFYSAGLVSKEDFTAALRGHQAAVDATKSPQREAAEPIRQNNLRQKQLVRMFGAP